MNKAAHRLLVWLSCAICAAAASTTTITARAQEPGTGFHERPAGEPAMGASGRTSSAPRCQVVPRATLPLKEAQGHFVTSLSINSHALPMVVDTGSARTTVATYLEDTLGLEPNYRRRWVTVSGVAGDSQPQQGMTAQTVLFGPSHLLNYNLTLADIARPGDEAAEGMPAGQIGADLLSVYDVEFDFEKHEMTLYSVSGCSDDFVPWPGPHQRFQAMRTRQNTLLIPIGLNRRPMLAMIDTGATITTLSRKAALAAGVDPAVLDQQKFGSLRGMGGMRVAMHLHRFDAVEVGSEGFRNAPIWVQDGELQDVDMLLGLDFLRPRKLWMAYGTNQVFIQARKQAEAANTATR